jgi:excisionase family DNA binding protein
MGAAEQHFRQIAREEQKKLLDEISLATAEADQNAQILTVQQAAHLVGITTQTVYQWIRAGKLKCFIIGSNSIRLKRGDVLGANQALIQANGRRKYARRGKEVARA